MKLEKFTFKAQEALQSAQKLAESYNHTELHPEHLLKAMIEQEGGIIPIILDRLGINSKIISTELDEILERLPRVSGGAYQLYLSMPLKQVLDRAEALAKEMRDAYISTEHLLLAIIDSQQKLAKPYAEEGQPLPQPWKLSSRSVREGVSLTRTQRSSIKPLNVSDAT